jgi:hypothetical protein
MHGSPSTRAVEARRAKPHGDVGERQNYDPHNQPANTDDANPEDKSTQRSGLRADVAVGTAGADTREHLGPTDLGILHFRKLVMDAARALQQGAAPPHLAHQERYTVRSGACVTSRAKDLTAVMIERFGDPAGFVGHPARNAAAE